MALRIREQYMSVDRKINEHDYKHDEYMIQFNNGLNPSYFVIKTENYDTITLPSGSTILSYEYMKRAYYSFSDNSKHKILCIRDDKDRYRIKMLLAIDDDWFVECTPEEALAEMESYSFANKLNVKNKVKRLLLKVSEKL